LRRKRGIIGIDDFSLELNELCLKGRTIPETYHRLRATARRQGH
jgi:hypothetical protein